MQLNAPRVINICSSAFMRREVPTTDVRSGAGTIKTVLVADVRGYTRFTERQGDEAAGRLAVRFSELTSAVIDAAGGLVVEFRGDEALAVFDSARGAIGAAIELQRRLADATESDPSLPLPTGIGLDAGEAVPVDGGYRGGALNRAARLCSLARAGEILCTDQVVHLAGRVAGVTYEDQGPVTVKNLTQPVRVVRVASVQDDAVERFAAAAPGDDAPAPARATAEGIFVGREREVAELEAGLDDLLAGRGRLFLIGGEAGIGKSRLADELGNRAKAREASVLWGRCWEAGGAPAYWPWVQAVRSYLRELDPDTLRSQLGAGAADVGQMLPEIHDLLPEVPQARVSSDPESARFRVFDSTTAFLRNAGKVRPLVLILDDLHAADAPSLLLLRFVSAELGDAPILIVGTYREEGPHLPEQLASTLAEVGRYRMTHIRLTGLDESEVGAFIEGVLEDSAPTSLVAAVYRETEGNPLFVGEVIRLLDAERQSEGRPDLVPTRIRIPARVREVIGRRLDLLSERCCDVLAQASVLGREFRIDALARVSGLPTEELLRILDEAAATRITTEVPGTIGGMRFSHALIRDTLYEDLTTAQRTRMHREVGETLESVYAEDLEPHLAELSYHFCEAAPGGDVDKAVEYARRAGERAAGLLAYEEGVRLFRLALQVLDLKGSAEPETRCRLLLALGDCQGREGDLEGAKETFQQAADLARKRGMAQQLAAAALGYGGRFVWARAGSDRLVVPLLEEALRTLPQGDSQIRARLMARLGGALRDQRSREEQDRLSREAVEVARRIGDPATLSYVLEGRFAATWWPENPEERLAIANEILGLARETDDGERIVGGLDWRAIALMELGDLAGVDAALEAEAPIVEELRQPAQWWILLHTRAMRVLLEGRFEEAERLITDALDVGQNSQRWDAVFGYRIQLYALRREQGRLAEVEGIIGRSVVEYPTRAIVPTLMAHLHGELGRPDESRAVFEELAANDFDDLRRDNDWLVGMTFLAEVADVLGDVGRAEILYGLLLPYAGRRVATAGEVVTGSVSRPLGLLASMLHRWDEAARHFEEALELNRAMGARPWVAHTQLASARMLLARDRVGDRDRASDLLSSARETCLELGMPALGDRIEALLADEGISPPAGNGGVAASPEATRGSNVFRREGEVWSIRFEQDAFRLKDSKGLRYLAQLLGSPGREFLALELLTGEIGSGPIHAERDRREAGLHSTSGGTAILDPQAKDAYRRRLEELQEELTEAEGWADAERAARAREEMEFLARELAGAVGLGGRDRRAPSDAERARVNVTKAIKSALGRIGEHSSALGHHLASTIRTGTFCSYVPDPRVPTAWQL